MIRSARLCCPADPPAPALSTDVLAPPQGSCLLDVFQRFEEAVEKYQAFWSALEQLDAELWVVDPERPSRRDVRRRVVISEYRPGRSSHGHGLLGNWWLNEM